MDAGSFIQDFLRLMVEKDPSGFGGEWTEGMYCVLEAIGHNRGYVVNSKKLNREINHIDFCYFKNSKDPNWHPPSVVIEHENAWDVEETKKDFWKCCLYAAPLRVTIGYMGNEQKALDAGRVLTEFFDAWKMPKVGETLLIYGWPQEDQTTRRWHYWLLGDHDQTWKVSEAQQAPTTPES